MMKKRLGLLCLPLLGLLLLLLGSLPGEVSAHAELLTADPPPDGLVLAAPSQLELTFTEPIASTATLSLVNDKGDPISTSIAGVEDRTLIVNVGNLDTGTYTVSWAVQSTTDGHDLSGTYSFRVGGGLPAGQATTEGERPAAWAVVLRWLSFLGAAIALGFFALSLAVGNGPARSRWPHLRANLLIAGAAIGLLATILEPVGQTLTAPDDQSVNFSTALRGQPDGWWWRPPAFAALLILALAIAYPLRKRISRPTAIAGAILAIGAILGLSLTSHAAGRGDAWKWPAVAIDYLHQISTALWVGGLIALLAWKLTVPEDSATLSRFSRAALIVFTVAVGTGVVNAGFVIPLAERIRDEGFAWSDITDAASSGYGTILIIKVVLLVAPVALAFLHRQKIERALKSTGQAALSILGRTLPVEAILVAMVVLGGSALALSAPPKFQQPLVDNITLVAPLETASGNQPGLGHLTVDPAQLGDNEMSLYLTDWNGTRIGTNPVPRVSLDFTSLDHNVTKTGVALQPDTANPGSWVGDGLDLTIDGWWRVTANLEADNTESSSASFYVLIPDPNTHSSGEAPHPKTDPAAEEVFNRGLARFSEWQQVRYNESLGSGEDVLVNISLAVTVGENGAPNAQQVQSTYSAGFRPINNQPVRPPRTNSSNTIQIGQESWRNTNGEWLQQPAGSFEVPSEWHQTYASATDFRLGITETVNGRQAQVITFYSPEVQGSESVRSQGEAFFTWWVDVETGDVLRVAMVARMHYMVWTYFDINTGFTIDRPIP